MKSDRRVQYTRRTLQESLVALMQEKPLQKISVKEICARADINRSTFYVHFGSPEEVLNSITEGMYEELRALQTDYSDIRLHMNRTCDVLYAHRELLQVLVQGRDFMSTLLNISFLWKDDFLKNFTGVQEDRQKAEATYLFITAGSCVVVYNWVLGNFSMPKEQMVDQVFDLIQHGLSDWFKED